MCYRNGQLAPGKSTADKVKSGYCMEKQADHNMFRVDEAVGAPSCCLNTLKKHSFGGKSAKYVQAFAWLDVTLFDNIVNGSLRHIICALL